MFMTSRPLLARAAGLAIICLTITPAFAHEMWIEPEQWQLQPGDTLTGDLIVGENFKGLRQRYNPDEFVRFAIVAGERETPVEGRLGDRPALSAPAGDDGLTVAVFVSNVLTTRYRDYAKFSNFVTHKALGGVLEAHDERGLARDDITEAYRRYAKALVQVGDGAGEDRRIGLLTELVALENPYGPSVDDGVDVELWYEGATVANHQIEVFEKPADGGDTRVFTLTTDAAGRATVPVRPGHAYLVDSVQMRVPEAALTAQNNAVWESLWASLTFRIP